MLIDSLLRLYQFEHVNLFAKFYQVTQFSFLWLFFLNFEQNSYSINFLQAIPAKNLPEVMQSSVNIQVDLSPLNHDNELSVKVFSCLLVISGCGGQLTVYRFFFVSHKFMK